MAPSLPSLLAHQLHRDASILPIEAAWEITLHWCDRLRDRVCLQRAYEESCTASYKWICFQVDLSDRGQVSAARAAAVTWFALSCCPGYSGNENPLFWKCVFSEYVGFRGGGARHHFQAIQTITDAYGFFDGDGQDFPRFKLSATGSETSVLLFCGHPRQELDAVEKMKLNQAMELLVPWVDAERAMRRPVVSLENVRDECFTPRCGQATKLTETEQNYQALARFITDSNNRSAATDWQSPVFTVTALRTFGGISKWEQLHEVLCNYDIDIPRIFYGSHRELCTITREEMAVIVRGLLRLPGSGVRARVHKLDLSYADTRTLIAIASALPQTTSIHSVDISINSEVLRDTVIVWLAYALFHPDTPASPWNNAVIRSIEIHERCVPVLQAMARGNSLAALLEGREPTSDGYYRARLGAKATVYDAPFASLLERFKRTAIVTSDGELDVEVCDVNSDDPKQWSKWVAVVVPAYGMGWVRSVDVASVVMRPAAEVSLVNLRLDCSGAFRSDAPPPVLESVLSVLGQRLRHLDLSTYTMTALPTDLNGALRQCPSLESLLIKHNGKVWTTEALGSVLPRLRELHLYLDAKERLYEKLVPFELPRSLHVLRVTNDGASWVYRDGLDAVRVMLSQPSQLRVFHWEDGWQASEYPATYPEMCEDTTQKLEELGLQSSQYVDVCLPPTCAAAFLSVLVHKATQQCTIARLDLELAKMIVEFAGTRETRIVVLEPEGAAVHPERRSRRIRGY